MLSKERLASHCTPTHTLSKQRPSKIRVWKMICNISDESSLNECHHYSLQTTLFCDQPSSDLTRIRKQILAWECSRTPMELPCSVCSCVAGASSYISYTCTLHILIIPTLLTSIAAILVPITVHIAYPFLTVHIAYLFLTVHIYLFTYYTLHMHILCTFCYFALLVGC